MLAMAAMVAIVLLFLTKPLQYMPNAVLAAVVFVIGIKLIDSRHMQEIYRAAPRRVLDRRGHGRGRRRRRRRAGHHPRDRALVARPREAPLRPARPRSSSRDAHGRLDDRCRLPRRTSPSPGSSSTASASASSTRMRRASPRKCSRSSTCRSRHAGSSSLADAIDDVDYTGGKTLVELADQLARAGRRLRRRRRARGGRPRARALRTDGEDRP